MKNKQPKGFAALALLSLLAMLSFGLFSAPAAQADSTVVVTENDVAWQPEDSPPTKSWVIYYRTLASTGTFRTGPAQPPMGVGSLELSTPGSGDKVTAFNFDHVGTALSDVNSISYSTYRSAGNAQQVAALNIQVDVNGTGTAGGFTTLVFEPVYNTNQGAVVNGQWQSWDAFEGGNAIWWSSNSIPGAPNRSTFVSWNTIMAANPDAVVLGVGINQGSGNDGLTTAVDAFTFGTASATITYNFEPSKGVCKDNGWQTMKRADGSSFKNQGDCVSYISNGK